jgi:hypothetical protein
VTKRRRIDLVEMLGHLFDRRLRKRDTGGRRSGGDVTTPIDAARHTQLLIVHSSWFALLGSCSWFEFSSRFACSRSEREPEHEQRSEKREG